MLTPLLPTALLPRYVGRSVKKETPPRNQLEAPVPQNGRIEDTYAAALQHDIYEGNATLIGVVPRPTGRFRTLVDENHSELGPPEPLLDEIEERQELLKTRGMYDEGAHNAAWEECKFVERYLAYLDAEEPEAVNELVARATSGEDLTLVCFEREGKRCHGDLLLERLHEQL